MILYSGSLYNETHENINQRLASHFFPDLVLSQIAIPAAITAPTKKNIIMKSILSPF